MVSSMPRVPDRKHRVVAVRKGPDNRRQDDHRRHPAHPLPHHGHAEEAEGVLFHEGGDEAYLQRVEPGGGSGQNVGVAGARRAPDAQVLAAHVVEDRLEPQHHGRQQHAAHGAGAEAGMEQTALANAAEVGRRIMAHLEHEPLTGGAGQQHLGAGQRAGHDCDEGKQRIDEHRRHGGGQCLLQKRDRVERDPYRYHRDQHRRPHAQCPGGLLADGEHDGEDQRHKPEQQRKAGGDAGQHLPRGRFRCKRA